MQRFIDFLRSPKKDWRHWTLLILLILIVVKPQSKQSASTELATPNATGITLDATKGPTITPVSTRTLMPTMTETPFPAAIVDANDVLRVQLADITKDTLRPTASDNLT